MNLYWELSGFCWGALGVGVLALGVLVFAEGGGRVSPRRAPHFLLLRQKKVSKEKATLLCVTPLLHSGATCDAHAVRGPRKLAFGSNSARP